MTKLKLLISVGTAATALVPLALFISSSVNGATPALLNTSELQTGLLEPLPAGLNNPSVLTSQELKGESSQEQILEISSLPERNNIYLLSESSPKRIRGNKQINQSTAQPNKELSKTDIQVIKKEEDLNKWLDIINPLIKEEQNLTIITRWESWYFRLIQWNKDCQCFVFSDQEYGIWTNSEGLLTIGKKWENPHKNVVEESTNPQCKNFDGFWYQDWHTWTRFNSWLKTSKNDQNGHKAIASCYRYPVTFLETNKYFPVFVKSRTGSITTFGPMNYYYNHQEGRFVRLEDGEEMPKHFSKISSYYDWQKLWNINGMRK